MIDVIKQVALPGSILTMLTVLAAGVVLLYVRPRVGRIWLTVVVAGYWLLNCPIGAAVLTRTLDDGYTPLARAADARGANAVVMLGAGSTIVRARDRELVLDTTSSALRALETARVFHLIGSPLVIVSGGETSKLPRTVPESEAHRSAVLALGVPAVRIVSESQSHNTHDEAVVVGRMLRERGLGPVVLVTSPLHMRRALATFAAQGIEAIPSPAPAYGDRPSTPLPVTPNSTSGRITDEAMHEWLSALYYWMRGWTRAGRAAS